MEAFTSTAVLGAALRRWIGKNDRQTVLSTFEKADLVSSLVYTPTAMLENEHMRARKNIINVEHPTLGTIPMPGVVPLLSDTPGSVQTAGPSLGQHTEEILSKLGYGAEQIADFRKRKIV
jgi:formyl-CoA transferase